MKHIFKLTTVLLSCLAMTGFAQQLEHMIPAGFNNPFLKSGQYISTVYYQNLSAEYDSKDDQTGSRRDEYNFAWRSFLGLTDQITLSAGILMYPEQTVSKGLYGIGGDMKNTLNVRPELVLTYRPVSNIEVFSAFDYMNYSSSYKSTRYTTDIPVGMDEHGNIIFEERTVTMDPMADRNTTFATFKVGVTLCGKLW